MSVERQAALWHRLRDDPDFEPGWLRAMGAKAPSVPDEHRAWGDGATRAKEHIIEDISFEGGWINCLCGETVTETSVLTLEDVWDAHRGRADLVAARAVSVERMGEAASDDEVAAFLVRASNPAYEFEGE